MCQAWTGWIKKWDSVAGHSLLGDLACRLGAATRMLLLSHLPPTEYSSRLASLITSPPLNKQSFLSSAWSRWRPGIYMILVTRCGPEAISRLTGT